ncbi:hypothetical protein HDU96_006429 [Phlyctochytrium bullatum]|nr:hypothetical protein HDU96_006429 [Phlyctochytrium bullatum]
MHSITTITAFAALSGTLALADPQFGLPTNLPSVPDLIPDFVTSAINQASSVLLPQISSAVDQLSLDLPTLDPSLSTAPAVTVPTTTDIALTSSTTTTTTTTSTSMSLITVSQSLKPPVTSSGAAKPATTSSANTLDPSKYSGCNQGEFVSCYAAFTVDLLGSSNCNITQFESYTNGNTWPSCACPATSNLYACVNSKASCPAFLDDLRKSVGNTCSLPAKSNDAARVAGLGVWSAVVAGVVAVMGMW